MKRYNVTISFENSEEVLETIEKEYRATAAWLLHAMVAADKEFSGYRTEITKVEEIDDSSDYSDSGEDEPAHGSEDAYRGDLYDRDADRAKERY